MKSLMSGSPTASDFYNPQHTDSSSTSMEPLHRALAAAQAAADQDTIISFSEQNQALTVPVFKHSQGRYPSSYGRTRSSPKAHDGLPSDPDESNVSQYSQECSRNTSTMGTKYDASGLERRTIPLAPSNPFRSPPPPMDIASRRKRVQHKPAALSADTLRSSRLSMGPRTVSHAEEYRRLVEGPDSSPMRRITSAEGNRNVLFGRVYKSGVESSQRTPIKTESFENDRAFPKHNDHSIRLPPSLTAASSLNSSLAPPTPMSPRGREMALTKSETPGLNISSNEESMNFVFNAGTGGFTTMEGDQDVSLADPPEATQKYIRPESPWPIGSESSDKQWQFEVPDEPLYASACDTFPMGLQMPQRSYMRTMSQPVTPAFGHFNPSFVFVNSDDDIPPDSCVDKQATSAPAESGNRCNSETPNEPTYIQAQDTFPSYLPPYLRATSRSKTFQFSHTTAADFLDECKPPLVTTNSASEQILTTINGHIPDSLGQRSGCEPEDGGEEPQSIKKELSPVLLVGETGCSTNDSTIVDEMKIKAAQDCNAEPGIQEGDLPGDDSCASDETEGISSAYRNSCHTIPKPALDTQDDGQVGLILPLLGPMRQALVERIMDEFWLVFNQDWAARVTQCAAGSSTSGNSKDRSPETDKVSSCTSQKKRQSSHDEDSPDEHGNKKPRKHGDGPGPSSKMNDLARFACPFRKNDPQKYSIHSHRVCALTSFETIARVKEHLYRNHKAAPYCKRCWKVFETEELLDSHATVPASSICEALPGHPPEGITPKEVAKLRSKAKTNRPQNEADRWNEIFRLLFPGESVPSPYLEPIQEHVPASPNSRVLASYDDYMHRQLPRLFRSRVEEVVRREMQPVEASLLANLERLIRECQDQLSSGFRETQMREQQPEVPPVQPAGLVAEPMNQPDTAEQVCMSAIGKDQQSSSDFFDAVLQPPPPQEEDYFLDFSASDAELFGTHQHTLSSSLSDSVYVSVPRCTCKELCRCLTSMIGFENRDVDISDPSYVDLAQDLETQDQGAQWQSWLENRE